MINTKKLKVFIITREGEVHFSGETGKILEKAKVDILTVYALGHIQMSAHKARKVVRQIRGRPLDEALTILTLMPYQAHFPIFKIVFYALANAVHATVSKKPDLRIIKAEVTKGTPVKKWKRAARGSFYSIKRPTCHISIVVKDISLDDYVYER